MKVNDRVKGDPTVKGSHHHSDSQLLKSNRDPDSDKILTVMPNHPKTSEIYPRQDDVFRCELQRLLFVWSAASTLFCLKYMAQRKISDVMKNLSRSFLSYISEGYPTFYKESLPTKNNVKKTS